LPPEVQIVTHNALIHGVVSPLKDDVVIGLFNQALIAIFRAAMVWFRGPCPFGTVMEDGWGCWAKEKLEPTHLRLLRVKRLVAGGNGVWVAYANGGNWTD